MRRAALLVAAWGIAGCTSLLVPRVEHPPQEDEPETEERAAIALAPVSLSRGGEQLIALEADGRVAHPACEGSLDDHGVLRDARGATVLELDAEGAIADGDGRPLFTLEGARLVRASGGAAVLEAERVTFEGSPDLALEVARAEGAEDELVLLLVAALSMCEPETVTR